jgi:hypothetical protein
MRRVAAAVLCWAAASSLAVAAPVCTQVIGFSQTRDWYEGGGAFEAAAGDEHWQLLARFGAAVNLWGDPNYEGWSEPLTSPCTNGSNAPDRVVLTVTGGWRDNIDRWVQEIEGAIATIEARIPSATEIVLQSVVGGPDHGDCYFEGTLIRDSWQHKHVDEAIARVAGGNILVGASPEVETCADYRDAAAHLTESGAASLGARLGAFYTAFDGTTTTSTIGGGSTTSTLPGGTTTTTLPSGCHVSDVQCSISGARTALAGLSCTEGCDCDRLTRPVDRIASAFDVASSTARPSKCRRKLARVARLGRRLTTRLDTALADACLDPPVAGDTVRARVADVVLQADTLRDGPFCARP